MNAPDIDIPLSFNFVCRFVGIRYSDDAETALGLL